MNMLKNVVVSLICSLWVAVLFFACTPRQGKQMEKEDVQAADASQTRDPRTPGFVPPPVGSDAFFPESQYLDPLPALEIPSNPGWISRPGVKIIYPDQGCQSWEACGLNDPEFHYFLITPGDYVSWGPLRLTVSGTPEKKRIIRYYDPQNDRPFHPEHPVKMAGTPNEAVLESVDLWGASHWIVHGLTFRGQASNKKGFTGGMTSRLKGADHNVIDYCLFEKVLGLAVIRMFDSNYNTIQQCVLRDKIDALGIDMGGIGISAGYQQESKGNRIVNNEIYDLTDAVGLVRNVARDGDIMRSQVGEAPGTIIENNDFYIQSSLHRQKSDGEWACAEDGLDIKMGTKSTDPDDRIRILNNRFWGFRPTDQSCGGSGSAGAGIVLHRDASNILIQGNLFFDMSQGLSVFAVNPKFPDEKVERVAVVNNLFYDIRDAIPGNYNSGLAFRLTADVDAYYNTVVNARQLLFVKEKKARHRFQCNTFINIRETTPWEGDIHSWSSLNAWYGYPDPAKIYAHQGRNNTVGKSLEEADLGDWTVYLRRWTGPEKRTFRMVAPGAGHAGPKVEPEQGCHCGPGGEGGRWWVE